MSDDTRNDGESPNPSADTTEPEASTKKRIDRRGLKVIQGDHIKSTAPTFEDVAYLAREFVLCTLPHSDPGDVRAWGRRNGDLTLSIKPGIRQDRNTGEYLSVGIPYGIIPRLILTWMVTEIRRTQSRYLELGHRFTDFLGKLGLSFYTGGGPRGDAQRVREQMERLFRSTISFEYEARDGKQRGQIWLDMQVAPQGRFWWSESRPGDGIDWVSWIEVSEAFYKAVMAFPMPLDVRVLRHIKDSSLGIDLYTILNREAFRAMQEGKPRFLAWEWLHQQTGNEYSGNDGLKNFRRYALVQIEAILAVHPGLIISVVKGRKGQKSGLVISNLSQPSILPKEPKRERPIQIEGEARPAPPLVAVPPRIQHLRPAAVLAFRNLYPGLDPYACQADFDAWQDTLPPEKKARQYNSAFLGFAKVWAKGKI